MCKSIIFGTVSRRQNQLWSDKYEIYTIYIAGTKSPPGVHYSPTHHLQQPTHIQHICCVHTIYKDIKFEKYEICTIWIAGSVSPPCVHYSPAHLRSPPPTHIRCVYNIYNMNIKYQNIYKLRNIHSTQCPLFSRTPLHPTHIYSGSQIEKGEQK